jgi:transcriptional regulator of acetoin/glycerol metabolism
VPKARYSPPTADVAARVDRIVELYERQQQIEAEYRDALVAAADPAGDAVPIAYLAERLGLQRKTVYRHLGRSMT